MFIENFTQELNRRCNNDIDFLATTNPVKLIKKAKKSAVACVSEHLLAEELTDLSIKNQSIDTCVTTDEIVDLMSILSSKKVLPKPMTLAIKSVLAGVVLQLSDQINYVDDLVKVSHYVNELSDTEWAKYQVAKFCNELAENI